MTPDKILGIIHFIVKEKESYYPTLLAPYVDIVRNELEAALFSIPLQELRARTLSRTEITESLSDFADRVSHDGLDQTIKSFAKYEPLEERVVLHAVSGNNYNDVDIEGDGRFYLDGDHTLALGFLQGEQAKPLWIGVVSFSLGSEVGKYSTELVEKLGSLPSLPVIVQIQGPTRHTYSTKEKYEDAKKVLGQLRWEKALVTLTLKWAEYMGIPAVYLLPSSLNKYRIGPDDRNEKLHVRYDVTAKRLGFRPVESGLFKALIDLSPNGDRPQC